MNPERLRSGGPWSVVVAATILLGCGRSPGPAVCGPVGESAVEDAGEERTESAAVAEEDAGEGVEGDAVGVDGVDGEAPAACSHVPGVCCVALQPLGDVPAEEIAAVSGVLEAFYGFEVLSLPAVELPRSAWTEPRRRWRAERLLDFLHGRLPEGCDRIAGLTVADVSTTKGEIEDWGILGLADLPGPASVFSTFRCRRRVRDVPAIERLRRVAIHEVGHTLGLPHCPTYGCFLEDAGGKAETIDRETFLCDVCRERLGWVE